ncbi:GNAT family N-acetyltransferase [Vibrio parahaemolyticus]|nr:GNAT family N-acetyltransferase [Vibrio parahaemolyticus]MBE3840225.1 GNAT family N-acetyltransferase [Vibrio parahaemolyticus]MBE4314047.1 GNAT family N-acetyltransferase [Vibrio parahaemolyticus]MBE4731022.1 GNAT family N-acetyltransferase [Vibrio parahaemolyticus]MBE4767305.1 GNAT family N-acetyltransferase [Vibrio parahaemolyticus]
MFAHANELAKSKGYTIVQLTTDKECSYAIGFYERLGFKATHKGFKLVL